MRQRQRAAYVRQSFFRGFRLAREPCDPLADQLQSGIIGHVRAQVGHFSCAAFRDAIQQNRAEGIAGRNDPRIRNSKVALGGFRIGQATLEQRQFVIHEAHHRAAGIFPMTMRAIHVQP